MRRGSVSGGGSEMDRSLADIVAEFNRQRVVDPGTADRSLLEAGRRLLEEHLQQESIEPEVAHGGYALRHRLGDYPGVVELLSRKDRSEVLSLLKQAAYRS